MLHKLETLNERLNPVIPTKIGLDLNRAVLLAESYPLEIQKRITILRNINERNQTSFIVGIIQNKKDGIILMSDEVIFDASFIIPALCEFNFNNNQKQKQ